jgi:hypothetical protein
MVFDIVIPFGMNPGAGLQLPDVGRVNRYDEEGNNQVVADPVQSFPQKKIPRAKINTP